MDLSLGLAGVVAIAPVMLVMYFSLRGYTYPAVEEPYFSDPPLFGLFAVGLVQGTVLFVVYTYFVTSWATLVTAIVFAVLLEVVKLITMNLKRFHGKSDTVFYGMSLGFGIAAAFAGGMAYYITEGSAMLGDGMDVPSWVFVFVYSVMAILLNGATGATIGEGIARKRPWEFFLQALIPAMLFQVVLIPAWSASSEAAFALSVVAAAAVAVVYFYIIVAKNLPRVVRDILRQQGIKGNR
ncbi:MAG: hypothetical protein GX224_03930 [Thermoplasmatales archaeon]|nr:hypothetical protein [Thermoplasmatales archaeon]